MLRGLRGLRGVEENSGTKFIKLVYATVNFSGFVVSEVQDFVLLHHLYDPMSK